MPFLVSISSLCVFSGFEQRGLPASIHKLLQIWPRKTSPQGTDLTQAWMATGWPGHDPFSMPPYHTGPIANRLFFLSLQTTQNARTFALGEAWIQNHYSIPSFFSGTGACCRPSHWFPWFPEWLPNQETKPQSFWWFCTKADLAHKATVVVHPAPRPQNHSHILHRDLKSLHLTLWLFTV